MTVQEPSGEFGLWPKVKALSGWPDSNEDVVGALAQDWRAADRVDGFAAEVAGTKTASGI